MTNPNAFMTAVISVYVTFLLLALAIFGAVWYVVFFKSASGLWFILAFLALGTFPKPPWDAKKED